MTELVRIGDRVLSLRHVIDVAKEGAGPRCDRVIVEPGRIIDLDEQETCDLRAVLSVVAPYRRHQTVSGVVVDEPEGGGEVRGD